MTNSEQQIYKSNDENYLYNNFKINWIIILSIILLIIGFIAVCIGPVYIPILDLFNIFYDKVFANVNTNSNFDIIIFKIRIPRVLLAGIVGFALAMSGATYQGLFRNNLADPYLIGVASGAGLGATIVIVTPIPIYFGFINILPFAAFLGAISAVLLAYFISYKSNSLTLTTLLLAGIAISSICGAITALLMIGSDPDIRPVLNWLFGSFSSARFEHVALVLIYLVPSLLIILSFSRYINILQLGEDHAILLGVNVEYVKKILIIAASLATAAAVSFCGLIGFVGLIAPHLVRLIWGTDYRYLIPLSSLLGAIFLILADMISRTVLGSSELPVGLVTAFCGGPFFLFVLRYQMRYR